MGRVIGKIVEVSGLSIKARLFELLPPYLVNRGDRESAPKINGFVKTRIGLDTAVCQVVGEYNEDGKDNYFLKLEVKGYFSDQHFIQGLRVLPIVSANVELMDSDDYRRMFASLSEEAVSLGNDLYDDNKCINVEINRLIPSHIGVFGNTGSGKSNTLTKILSTYFETIKSKNTNAGKFIVLDLNNEYGSNAICDEKEKTIYKLSTGKKGSPNKIPLNIDDLEEDDFVVLMNASQKTQAPVVKTAYKNIHNDEDGEGGKRNEQYYLNYLKSILHNSKRQLFQSMRHYLGEYISNIDNFKYHSQQAKFYYLKPNGEKVFSDERISPSEILTCVSRTRTAGRSSASKYSHAVRFACAIWRAVGLPNRPGETLLISSTVPFGFVRPRITVTLNKWETVPGFEPRPVTEEEFKEFSEKK